MPKKTREITKETDRGTEVRCPSCGKWQPLEEYRPFTLNPNYVTELTPVLQCLTGLDDNRTCLHIFAPTALVFKMHRDMLAGVKEK